MQSERSERSPQEASAPHRTTRTNFIVVPEHRLKDAKEIFEKAVREEGLKVHVQKDR